MYMAAVKLKMCNFMLKIFIIHYITTTAFAGLEGGSYSGSDFTLVTTIRSFENVTFLVPNVKYLKDGKESFGIFCVQAVPKSVLQMWRSVQLVLLDVPLKYDIIPGNNETEVLNNYNSKSLWQHPFNFFDSSTVVDFPAFSPFCVGIDSKEKFSFYLKVRVINYWKVLQTIFGTFLYLMSPTLSRNSFFHYTTGISVGVLASFLILLFVISRFIPKKGASYAVLVFGYSFILYVFKVFWRHFNDIITQYLDYVVGYCVIAAFLSFIVCYRMGPVCNQRTFNIIQWCMQGLSLLLIFFSSEYREVSTALILLLLTGKMIPSSWIKKIKFLWYRCFPPKVKLLTEIEFIEQGNIETKKALDSLRQYCNSPDCKVWKVVRKLKDPVRFANFIENGCHYTDQELLAYNSDEENIDIHDWEESTNI